MTERNHVDVVKNIIDVLNEYVTPAVEQHGGVVNFVNFENGIVLVELSGACSGCAGSYYTLKSGIENILRQMVPEVNAVEGIDDPNSTVDPFYSDDYGYANWDTIPTEDIDNDTNH